MDHLARVIGQRIKDLRERSGLSQTGFAKRIGVTASLISQLENEAKKKPSADVLQAISKEFGISVDYLFGGESTPLFINEELVSFMADFQALDVKDRTVVREVVNVLKRLRLADQK